MCPADGSRDAHSGRGPEQASRRMQWRRSAISTLKQGPAPGDYATLAAARTATPITQGHAWVLTVAEA